MPELASQTSAPITIDASPTPAVVAQALTGKKPAKKGKATQKPTTKGKPDAKKNVAEARPSMPDTLTKPQIRILMQLAKAKSGLSLAGIADKAAIAQTWVGGFVRKAGKANRTASLVEQKLVKVIDLDVDGKTEARFEITATGRKIVEKIK